MMIYVYTSFNSNVDSHLKKLMTDMQMQTSVDEIGVNEVFQTPTIRFTFT